MKSISFKCEMFFLLFFSDLPLKISYPPDFSDSRHYGLLLLVYVAPNTTEMCDAAAQKTLFLNPATKQNTFSV